MMGKMNKQSCFDDVGWRERIPQNSFWWKLHNWATENLCESDFQDLFSQIGRPSVSPIHTLLGVIIQFEKGYSDREFEEESRYDERVKLALLAGRNFPGIDAVTLCNHRRLFFESGMGEQLLNKTLELALERGLLSKDKRTIVDSFMISGAATVQDTYTLIKAAIIKTLFVAKCHDLDVELPKLERSDYDQPGKPRIDWNADDEKEKLLAALVRDAFVLVDHFESLAAVPDEVQIAVTRLQTIAKQDVVIEGDDVKMLRGTAKDRVISVVDQDMRHGRKTSSKKSNGYKGHVIVGGEKGEIVESVEVTPANAPDAEPVPAMLDELEEKNMRPEELLGDTAYASLEMKEEQAEKGTTITAKVAPSSNRNGMYNKDRFTIDFEDRTITCPAEQIVTMQEEFLIDRKGGTVSFAAEICNVCPLKDQCTKSNNGRSISIHPYEQERTALKKIQETEEFKLQYAYRSHVERKIAHLVLRGGRVARYFGQVKTRAQLLFVAATNNIKVLQAKNTGELCQNTGI